MGKPLWRTFDNLPDYVDDLPCCRPVSRGSVGLQAACRVLTPALIRAALAGGSASACQATLTTPRAGVAIVLSGDPSALSICFMQRVKRRGDRWSGDVALPGGWAKARETALSDTARRETREEVGIELHRSHHLGDLEPIQISRNDLFAGVIGASAFYTGPRAPHLTPDPREVADAFWVPCRHLYDASNHAVVHWSRSGPPQPRPAVRIDERVIWGLTYRVLVRFSAVVLGENSPLVNDLD